MVSRNWLGTYNNIDTTHGEAYLSKWFSAGGAIFVTGQIEKGAGEGTIHMQYFLHFKKNMRVSALKKHCKHSHFELVKVNNGADDYCNKEDTRVEGPWTFGVKPARLNKKGDKAAKTKQLLELGPEQALQQGLVSLGRPYMDLVKSVDMYRIRTSTAREAPDVRGVWIWGPPGLGKSYKARHDYGDSLYLKAQNKWWDGYVDQKTVIIDDMDTDVLGHYLKIWADRYACNGETKGGNVALQHDTLIVTSNYSIDKLWEGKTEMIEAIRRRFKVLHLTDPLNVKGNRAQ